MSEKILRALMQMFAIIAKVDGVTNTGRSIVQSFLKQQLSNDLVQKYLSLFDDFLESHHQISKRKDGTAKRTSLNSVKVLKICNDVNKELEQTQKVVVLIRILEFVYSSNDISEQELEFATTVADAFNISNEEFLSLKFLVESKVSSAFDREGLLIVNDKLSTQYKLCKHIHSDGMTEPITILSVKSVGMYVLKYYGHQDLILNGQPVTGDKIYILNPGSSIRSSKINPVYYSDIISKFLSDKTKEKVSFYAKELNYKFTNGKLGLRDISISEESGKLIGIMGGSGAGKSTLLNVLNGNEKPSSGSVLINGINIHKNPESIEGVIGHVSQDDLLIEELTVYQNLFYNAKLCFGNLSEDSISKMVMDMLVDLGLQETRDLKVGSPLQKTISGGQRKRLNIALELIREPSVLFVDEPTSGLSSRDSENIMDLLKELALKGKLIYVVIHQPSSDIYKMFDKMMILDVGGYPIYYGNPVDAVVYFKRLINHVNPDESECIRCGNVNPEQVFNMIEAKVLDEYGNVTVNRKMAPKDWNAHYQELIAPSIQAPPAHKKLPESTFKIPNPFKQYSIFTIRDVLSKLTNTQYMVINILEAPLLAFILAYLVRYFNTDIGNLKGYIFRENENIPAYLFMSVVVSLFIGLTVSAEEIIRDRRILKRESFLNLSRGSYLFSKIGILFTLSAIQSLMFVLVGNSILGVKGMYVDYFLVLFTTSCFANMLGLNISSAFNSAVTIYILIPFLLIPQLLLSGVIVKFEKLNPTLTNQSHVPLAGEIMASRWAYEALAVNQFRNNKFEREFYKYDKAISNAEFKKVYWLDKIKNKVAKIDKEINDKSKDKEREYDLEILKLEIQKELKASKKVEFKELDYLIPGKYSLVISDRLQSYFTNIKNYYIDRANKARELKDKQVKKYTDTPEKKAAYLKLQEDYENQNLAQLVTNSNELNERCLEKDGKMIQRIDQVYLDPSDRNDGRAHFFAPHKRLFGAYFSTFSFNIAVIWLMSILLAISLYYDLLRKLLEIFDNFKYRKKTEQ
jgi:ABC transport system ATP-binding/permease protein